MCTDYGAVTHLHSIHCRYLVSHFINISFTDLIIKRKRVAGSACLSFNGSDYNSFEMRMRLSVNVLCVWLTAHLFLAFSCFFLRIKFIPLILDLLVGKDLFFVRREYGPMIENNDKKPCVLFVKPPVKKQRSSAYIEKMFEINQNENWSCGHQLHLHFAFVCSL